MRKWIVLLLASLFFSCSNQYVTMERFDSIPFGAGFEEVERTIGAPYKRETKKGQTLCLYIERINLDKETRMQRHYTLTFSEGKMVEKSVKEIKQNSINANF